VKPLQFRLINIRTPAYEAMVALRMEVLLNPIGIPRSYINAGKEAGDLLLGAYQDQQLIGCCILTRVSETTVQLRQMAVAQSLQGLGIGAAILHYAEGLALEKGYRLLLLHARNNVISFYRKSGYTPIGEPFFEVGIGHLKMQKQLSP
jgi:predicted GNAT family N-acyltransferase